MSTPVSVSLYQSNAYSPASGATSAGNDNSAATASSVPVSSTYGNQPAYEPKLYSSDPYGSVSSPSQDPYQKPSAYSPPVDAYNKPDPTASNDYHNPPAPPSTDAYNEPSPPPSNGYQKQLPPSETYNKPSPKPSNPYQKQLPPQPDAYKPTPPVSAPYSKQLPVPPSNDYEPPKPPADPYSKQPPTAKPPYGKATDYTQPAPGDYKSPLRPILPPAFGFGRDQRDNEFHILPIYSSPHPQSPYSPGTGGAGQPDRPIPQPGYYNPPTYGNFSPSHYYQPPSYRSYQPNYPSFGQYSPSFSPYRMFPQLLSALQSILQRFFQH